MVNEMNARTLSDMGSVFKGNFRDAGGGENAWEVGKSDLCTPYPGPLLYLIVSKNFC
jgi:hypothetical protein